MKREDADGNEMAEMKRPAARWLDGRPEKNRKVCVWGWLWDIAREEKNHGIANNVQKGI